ncbi:probable acyl-activating enzyme 16, chloroplastic isoform X2 [Dioscorea cayenensis subsp. rotundata]|uniref:4-coumarate--CoA ligase n=1 Tax=Dioscorea cayennensis subsp. rotundata TaxID=55577 RepID=A0AB40B5A7_DIOCR|nr:probable acyl-activating enzyme 16, chloroplastic isoform X2 [Dioscorea cayenensis subsp. rotundata]
MAICVLSATSLCLIDRRRSFLAASNSLRSRRRRRSSIVCNSEVERRVIRRCSPFLEGVTLKSTTNLATNDWKVVPDIWKSSADKYGDRVALVDPYHEPTSEMTYRQLEQEILDFAEGLRVIGVVPDEKLALFADNSSRWLVADQGIMAMGAINVVRGMRSSDEELLQIYKHSESVALVVESPEFFNRLAKSFISEVDKRFIILLWGEKTLLNSGSIKNIRLFDYKEIIKLGKENRDLLLQSCVEGKDETYETISPDDVATLMYTSGTSGTPKGVMLTHRNLLHQEDLKRYQPQYLISVPLVYETLYSSIQKQISSSSAARRFIALMLINVSLLYMEAKRIYEGKFLLEKQTNHPYIFVFLDWLWARLVAATLCPLHNLALKLVYSKIHSAIGISKAGISGGGSLPNYVDKFFEAIGVRIQNGYGLTESSPVLAARRPACNVLGTVGHPLNHTEIKIIDAENGEVLPDGLKGIVKVRGPQVMKGYFKNPSATSQALDGEGWLNTGDIGWIAPKSFTGRNRECGGMLVLEGRAKDTIVLTTGENIEPSELEDAALRSNLIQQIVVIGQDQRRLGALIVPNKEELLAMAKEDSLSSDPSELNKDEIMNLLHHELSSWTSGCLYQIGPILIVDEPFTIENGLMTPTMKVRRDRVVAQYKDRIAKLYQ